MVRSRLVPWLTLVLTLADLPEGSSYSLSDFAASDLSSLPDEETMGTEMLRKHQELMLKHWGHMDSAVLPDDVIQQLMLGVSVTNASYPTIILGCVYDWQDSLTMIYDVYCF